ncbi:hypothetical protein [Parafrigoribacterium soli]|uniref:hypothetical protein n=1 Tax=Parafrigoribacterium soli TaxID=3144663 RepID=UPI0032ECB781
MTEATSGPFERMLRSRWALWSALLLVHLWLSFANLHDDPHPLGDVSLVYRAWMEQGFATQSWVGLDRDWVYPILAIVPMLIAWAFGPENYAFTWLALVIVLDAIAFGFLIGWSGPARNTAVAWWWLGFLMLLGPISLARLDTVSVPLAIVAVLYLATRPRLAGALLAAAAWIKVWPGAILIAAVVATRERWRVLTAAVLGSVLIAGCALVLGGGAHVLSFVTQQADRGLQIEAPVSTAWLWQAAAGARHARVYYDTRMLTFQVTGDGADAVSALMTPLLVLVVAAILLLALLAVRARVQATALLAPLALALVVAFVAFNKVGSPQYLSWLAAPVILGLVTPGGRSFRAPAALTLVLAFITQLIYPTLYDGLLALETVPLVLLTVRNLLLFVLLGWSILAIWRAGREDLPRLASRRNVEAPGMARIVTGLKKTGPANGAGESVEE